jgi:hypothetical protein
MTLPAESTIHKRRLVLALAKEAEARAYDAWRDAVQVARDAAEAVERQEASEGGK